MPCRVRHGFAVQGIMILILLGIALIQVFFTHYDALKWMEPLALLIHQKAVTRSLLMPEPVGSFIAAFLFGGSLQIRKTDYAFRVLGIYHLIVVSGSHLRSLEWILNFLTRLRCAQLLSLFIFTLSNRMEPSCLRAFVQVTVSKISPRFQARPLWCHYASILLCLSVRPQLLDSLAFQLSCLASLAVNISEVLELLPKRLQNLQTTFLATVLTCPLILPLAPCISSLVLPANLVFIPVFERLIMPVSLLAFILPPMAPWLVVPFEKLMGAIQGIAAIPAPEVCVSEFSNGKGNMILWFVLWLSFSLLSSALKRKKISQNIILFQSGRSS
jgi:ComEC/Rec2-related protein